MTNLFTNLSNWKVKYLCALLMFVCFGVGTAWGTSSVTGTYKLVTSKTGIAAGDTVLLVNKAGTYALTGISTGSTKYGLRQAVTSSNGIITLSSADVEELKVEAGYQSTGFSFKGTGDISYYLYWTSGNSLSQNSTKDKKTSWTLSSYSAANGMTIYNQNDVARILRYNTASGQERFACYTSETGTLVNLYKKVYAVKYDKNGGTGSMTDSSSPYTRSSTVTVLACTFTAPDGKVFDKWNTKADGSGTDYDPEDSFSARNDVTLYAQWKLAASCSADPTVGSVSLNGSFNLNSIPLQASVSSDGGTGCSITEAGFVWTSDGTDPTISNNKTTGTYSTNITGTIPSAGSFSTGVTYKIKAYATNGHGDGLSSSSFTLIPRSVTFNLNGHGSSTPSVQYVNNGGLATDPSYSESVTGYTFGGWYKEAGCSNSWTFGSDAVSGENKTLYAKWTAKNYTITLNQDLTPTSAGTTSIAVTYNSNDNLTSAITPPTKTGWTFAGYYTEKNGNGTQIIDADGNVNAGVATYTDASKNWIKASGVTLYAKWTCTVTWSVNNLTNVYSAQTLTYNGTSTKVASVPGPPSPATYCGDKFVGWTTEENVAQDDDDGLGLFTNVAGSPELKTVGNTTFYAVFADYDE